MANPLTDTDFLFRSPENKHFVSNAANISLRLGSLASRLVQEFRTRTDHPDGRPENVAEHSFMLAKVAPELAMALYPKLDRGLIVRFAVVHDDVEAYVGDTPTDMKAGLDQSEKDAREAAGLAKLLEEHADMPDYCSIIRLYESQSIPEARFVRAVDKLMVCLIHIPNQGQVLKQHYNHESYLRSEQELAFRDGYKYGEFAEILEIRKELAQYLADTFLE